MKYLLNFLKKQPVVTMLLAVIIGMAGILSLDGGDIPIGGFVLRILLSGTMGVYLYLISGEKAIQDYSESTGYVIKTLSVYWILAGIVGLLGMLMLFDESTVKYENWYVNLLLGFFEMLAVGLFEELLFRAIINDSIIYQFRNCKGVFVLSAVVSFLVFGAVHIVPAVLAGSVYDTNTALQAVMKTVQTGVLGLTLLVMYWKSRNIWACAVLHGIYDFLLALHTYFVNIGSMGGYVSTDSSAGNSALIMYSVTTVIELLIFFRVWKKVGKTIDFEKLRQEW